MKRFYDQISGIYANQYTGLVVRLLLGAVFLLAGIGKVGSTGLFIRTVSTLSILPWQAVEPVARTLPWIELALGISLLIGLKSGIAAAASLPLSSMFIVFNILNLQHAIENPCGACFGDLLVLTSRNALILDIFMVLAAVRVVCQAKPLLSVESLFGIIRRQKVVA